MVILEDKIKKKREGGVAMAEIKSVVMEWVEFTQVYLHERDREKQVYDVFVREFKIEPDSVFFENERATARLRVFLSDLKLKISIMGHAVWLIEFVVKENEETDYGHDWKFSKHWEQERRVFMWHKKEKIFEFKVKIICYLD